MSEEISMNKENIDIKDKPIKKGKNPMMRCVLDYARNHKWAFSIALICIFFVAVGNIVAPVVIQQVTNIYGQYAVFNELTGHYVLSVSPDELWSKIFPWLMILVTCYVISVIGSFSYSLINATYGQKYMDELRKKVFNHMESLPISYFDRHDKGDIMSVYLNDIDTVRQFLIQSIPEIMISGILFVCVLFVMLFSSIYLILIVMLFVAWMFIVTYKVGGKSSKNFVAQQRVLGKEEGYVEETMNGLKVIKSFNHEEQGEADFDVIVRNLQDVSTKANSYANTMMPILGNIGNILYVVIAIVGTLLYIGHVKNPTLSGSYAEITVGIVVSFLPMVKQMTNNASQMANQVNSVGLAYGGCERICQLMDETSEVDDGYVTLVRAKYDEQGNIVEATRQNQTIWAWKHPHTADGTITYTLLEGDIRMFDVDFAYNPNKVVLHDITLYAKPGQKVAFVGSTGAGKTTITNLLNRFYDIADGKIRYDGININKIKKSSLRGSLGMVLQDTNLFTGTIMDNIRYGRLDATDEECIAAAKLANADSFITRLPNGYQTMLTNDGGNLSQGQRQLLSIARAAVNDAPVLILDEATSSIDTRTEAIVTKGMDNLMNGRTVFVIAHRLSTIQNSDVIMVLDHGKIIERGTHDQLIDMKGTYYQLYTGAFELE